MATPNDAVNLFQQASEHDAAGREAEAVPLYEGALALGLPDPLAAQALVQLGSSLRNVGRAAHAVAVLDGARGRFPDDAAVRIFRALALESAGRCRDAVVELLRLVGERVDTDETRRYARAIRFYTEDLAAR